MTPTRMKYYPLEQNIPQIDDYYMMFCPHATNSWFQELRAEQDWPYLLLCPETHLLRGTGFPTKQKQKWQSLSKT